MKVGQLFDLPTDILYSEGVKGVIRDRETNAVILARYEVVKVEGELKGRVYATYGHTRRNGKASE